MSTKRYRESSSTSLSPSPSPEPTPKAIRTALPADSSVSSPLLCTLPPTCNPPHNRPTPLADTGQLESHYATYHAHVCEEKGCGCVFPDARLLELHQTECHNPLAAVRKDRGEKIFACHVATCPRRFLTPKTRRLHLIEAHGYPKEYFFAVTNKGVGGLLKRWGEGVSMVRGQWKPRDDAAACEGVEGDSESEIDDGNTDAALRRTSISMEGASDAVVVEYANTPTTSTSDTIEGEADVAVQDDDMDTIMGIFDSLSLVPRNIKFGRGASMPGFGHERASSRGVPGTRGRGRASVAPRDAGTRVQSEVSTRGAPGAGNLRRGMRGFLRGRANASGARGIGRADGRGASGAARGATRGVARGGRAGKGDYGRGRSAPRGVSS
ncbi:hypothetical protein POSPLADRAFT_1180203 [Postia placenta MAD-698-R-SB12]|uniref:C2H2-type domain-containing protein n=1 Tax=Postia placenta MAD-698-R-SB12 TaxID=670580 RepID=A0A1X6N7H8_9APHY|nr:hypothetical protein POSPLADRAFT_1180203 [Postia placenta MAD-698-R-SB12]OSX64577.1 hypothetical protein POSPLADRAFT_1180203 [Postia placenta MAD-698-R-SB12]